MVSKITRFYWKPDMTSSWFRRQGALNAIFNDWFWKSDRDLLIVFYYNSSSGMHGFRDNKVLLQARYDVIMIYSPRGASGNFYGGFWKSDHYFLIAFLSNFLSGMHSFRDNKVSLPTGYDVIMISPLKGASGNFLWRILKEQPWLPDSVL